MLRRLTLGMAVVAALAAPALAATGAVVLDADDKLPAAAEARLLADLGKMAPNRVVVVYLDKAPADIEAVAEEAFRREGFDRDDLAIAIAIGDRKVAAHVGKDLTARGVNRDVIVGQINERFKRHARAGDYGRAASELADGLRSWQPPRARVVEPQEPARPEPAQPAEGDGDGGNFWQVLMMGLVGLGGLIALFLGWLEWGLRKDARKRIQGLKDDGIRLSEALLRLDDAMALAAAGGTDPFQAAATAAMEQARAYDAKVAALAAAVGGGSLKPEHKEEAHTLDMVVLNLEVTLGALRTAYGRRADYPDHADDGIRDALVIARSWKVVDAKVAYIREKSLGSGPERALLADLLARARAALVAVPTQPAMARSLIAEAERTMEKFKLEWKAADAPSGGASGATAGVAAGTPVYVDPTDAWAVQHIVVTHHYEPPPPAPSEPASSSGWGSGSSGDSGSSSWSSSSSDDSGSSSWSSSSSDDSGSSSWSSSDSGSSSWDSSSSSSSDSSSSSGSSGSDNW